MISKVSRGHEHLWTEITCVPLTQDAFLDVIFEFELHFELFVTFFALIRGIRGMNRQVMKISALESCKLFLATSNGTSVGRFWVYDCHVCNGK